MKNLSAINEKIISLLDRVEEIEDYEATSDFDTREEMIVANIKTYSWVDEGDVLDIINPMNLSEETEALVLEEFDTERLGNIYNHACEDFCRNWKEELEDRVHINNLPKRANVYTYFKNPDGFSESFLEKHKWELTYYEKEFTAFKKRKKNSYADYIAYIRKENKFDHEEAQRLNRISPEVHTYGRSGGWLSVCSVGVLENIRFNDAPCFYNVNKQDNDEVNAALRDYFGELPTRYRCKKKLIREIESFISEWQKDFDAVNHYVEQIEKSKQDFKSHVIDRLSEEISVFLSEIGDTPNCSVTIEGDIIRTSMGVTVPANEFKLAYIKLLQATKGSQPGDKVDFRMKVGRYTTERAIILEDDIIVKAGCHRFSLNGVKSSMESVSIHA